MKLKEGLRRGDLEGLVLPLLTIDEYDSKISNDDSIVVGFYVFEQDAAHDLSNFVERAPYQILDTDVSPAPTKDGYYLCFVEINRTKSFPDALVTLLTDVTKLCNVQDWQFTALNLPRDKILPLTLENLQKHVSLDAKDIERSSNKSVLQFFKESALNDVQIHTNFITLHRQSTQAVYKSACVSSLQPEGAVALDESSAVECVVLEKLLGGPYSVHKINNALVVENWANQTFLTLQPI
jgi:hypothetical protein